MWERILGGCSDWLVETVQRQQAVEDYITPGDLCGLAQQHSASSETDTLKLGPVEFVPPERDADHVEALHRTALSSKASAEECASTVKADIRSIVDADTVLDLSLLTADLTGVKDRETSKVAAASASLGEIVSRDPQKRKGRDDVLKSKHQDPELSQMQADAKDKAYREIRMERISHRRGVTSKVVEELSSDSLWKEKLAATLGNRIKILAKSESLDEFRQRASTAQATKEEVIAIVSELENAKQEAEQKLAQCKVQKAGLRDALSKKREHFKALIEQLMAEERAFSDLNIEHEASRIQIRRLEESLAATSQRLDAARQASLPAIAACEEWQQSAEAGREQLQQLIEQEAVENKTRASQPAHVAGLNIALARHLVGSLKEENNSEMEYVTKELTRCDEMLQSLQAEMVAEEPDHDLIEVEAELAKCTDEQKTCKESMEKCRATEQKLRDDLSAVQERERPLMDLQNWMGCAATDDEHNHNARDLVDSCYTKFQLFKGKSRSSSTPLLDRASSTGLFGGDGLDTRSDALVAMDPRLKAWIEQLIETKAEQKAEQKLQQFRADQLFRQSTSEAGESWVKEFAPGAEDCSAASECSGGGAASCDRLAGRERSEP